MKKKVASTKSREGKQVAIPKGKVKAFEFYDDFEGVTFLVSDEDFLLERLNSLKDGSKVTITCRKTTQKYLNSLQEFSG